MYELKNTQDLEQIIQLDYPNMAGLIVMKNGKNMYENYFNHCDATTTIHIASATKSIISILIGIAIDKGFLKSIDQHILEFFPYYTLKRGEKNLPNITIKHMLTMTAPYKFKSQPYTKLLSSED